MNPLVDFFFVFSEYLSVPFLRFAPSGPIWFSLVDVKKKRGYDDNSENIFI